jgi:hypothetical protein
MWSNDLPVHYVLGAALDNRHGDRFRRCESGIANPDRACRFRGIALAG